MGLFSSPEEKEAKRQEKLTKALAKYHVEELNNKDDMNSVRAIAVDMLGYGFFEVGELFGNDSATFRKTAQTNRVIMEQNFIMIRQLDRIAKLLEERKA